MFSVIISYLRFHYGTAISEGISILAGESIVEGLGGLIVGIPLLIVWLLLPLVILSLFISGLYFIFLWNVA